MNYIDKEYASIPSDVIKDARTSELLENEISNSIDIQNLNIDPRFTYNDDYELLKKLSPEEANKIYNNLVDKKIL